MRTELRGRINKSVVLYIPCATCPESITQDQLGGALMPWESLVDARRNMLREAKEAGWRKVKSLWQCDECSTNEKPKA